MVAELVSLHLTTCKLDWQTELDQKTYLNDFSSKHGWRKLYIFTYRKWFHFRWFQGSFLGTRISRGRTAQEDGQITNHDVLTPTKTQIIVTEYENKWKLGVSG